MSIMVAGFWYGAAIGAFLVGLGAVVVVGFSLVFIIIEFFEPF